MVKDELLIPNLGGGAYLDTTFGPRRWELFEMTPPSKNTLLINGVGVEKDSRVATRLVRIGGHRGVRLDATEAMGRMQYGPVTAYCTRTFVMIEDFAVLIIDRVEPSAFAHCETRIHTRARVNRQSGGAVLRGERQSARISWAADVPAQLHVSQDAMTVPTSGPPSLVRWCTVGLQQRVTLATLIVAGLRKSRVRVDWAGSRLIAQATIGNRTFRLPIPR